MEILITQKLHAALLLYIRPLYQIDINLSSIDLYALGDGFLDALEEHADTGGTSTEVASQKQSNYEREVTNSGI